MCNYVLKIRLLPSNVNTTTAMIGRDFVVGQADWLHSSSSLLRIWLGLTSHAGESKNELVTPGSFWQNITGSGPAKTMAPWRSSSLASARARSLHSERYRPFPCQSSERAGVLGLVCGVGVSWPLETCVGWFLSVPSVATNLVFFFCAILDTANLYICIGHGGDRPNPAAAGKLVRRKPGAETAHSDAGPREARGERQQQQAPSTGAELVVQHKQWCHQR